MAAVHIVDDYVDKFIDRFTPQVLASIRAAQEHARQLDRPIAGAEDLLFGAMCYERGAADHESKVVVVMEKVFNVTRIDVHDAIKAISTRPLALYIPNQRFSKGAHKALKHAAERSGKGFANRFDLVVGLVESKDVVLYGVLETLQVDPVRLSLVMSNSLAWVGSPPKS